jgi:hypothetical protein
MIKKLLIITMPVSLLLLFLFDLNFFSAPILSVNHGGIFTENRKPETENRFIRSAEAAAKDLSFFGIEENDTINTIEYKIEKSPFAIFEPIQLARFIKGDLPLSEASVQVNELTGQSPADSSGLPDKLIDLVRKIYKQEKSISGEGGNILYCLSIYPKDAPSSMFCGSSKLYFSDLTKKPLIFNICVKRECNKNVIEESTKKFGSPTSEEPPHWIRKKNILLLWPQSTPHMMYSIYFSNNINEHLKQVTELFPHKPL